MILPYHFSRTVDVGYHKNFPPFIGIGISGIPEAMIEISNSEERLRLGDGNANSSLGILVNKLTIRQVHIK